MKKLFGKALAMAVMMSVLAGGSAYAEDSAYFSEGMVVIDGADVDDRSAILSKGGLHFYPGGTPDYYAFYGLNRLKIGDITLDDKNGLKMGGLDITGVNNLTVTGTLNASASGAIASGDTGLVTGGAVYTALQDKQDKLTETQLANLNADHSKYLTEHQDISGKADKATTLAGYGITDGATKTELEGKADKATTLAGYGITDGATKTELEGKADKATTLAGYGITDAYTKSETDTAIAAATYDDTAIKADIAKKADKTDLDAKADKSALETEATTRQDADDNLQSQIDTLSSSASAGMSELASKINQTDARMDRVGATAAALAAINYQPMAKGQSQVAIGMGGYNGKKATAIGLAYQFDNRISGSVAGAANGSERMFNVGFNYLFGQHSAKNIAPMAANTASLKEAELQAQVDSLKADNQAMQAKMAKLEAMVKALAAK